MSRESEIWEMFAGRNAQEVALRGLILAGGSGSRLGRDKALLTPNGRPQVVHLLELLEGLTDGAWVAVRPARAEKGCYRALPLVTDSHTGLGPVAGILSGLQRFRSSALLVVAVDMPLVSERLLRVLIDERDPTMPGTAFWSAGIGRPLPFPAIYEPAMAGYMRKAAARGRYGPSHTLAAAGCKTIPLDEPRAMKDIDTPSDLRALTQR